MNRSKICHINYVILLFLMAVAIPISNFLMSASAIFLLANWVVEGNWKKKWYKIKTNKTALILSSFLVVFLLGFIHTNQWSVGLDNLLSKLILFFAPLMIVSSSRLTRKEFNIIMSGFVLTSFIASVISVIYWLSHDVIDIREISLFISHIRFSLCIVFSIVLLFYYLVHSLFHGLVAKCCLIFLILWFSFYLFVAQTFTGLIILFVILVAYIVYELFHFHSVAKWWAVGGLLFLVFLFMGYFVVLVYHYYVPKNRDSVLEAYTVNHRPYTHDTTSIVENGQYTEVYVCDDELAQQWKQRSNSTYDEMRRISLIRYLNSMGLRKDSVGVSHLSDIDIRYIEKNVANVEYTHGFGIKRALYPILFGFSAYYHSNKIEGSSLLQRIELWKNCLSVIRNNWLFGVGIGDHREAVKQALQTSHSPLDAEKINSAHNQYLTFWLMGGVFVFLYFLFILFYPLFIDKKEITFVYIAFFIIIFLSMLTEDTLESQAGMTFYIFFNTMLLFAFPNIETNTEKS